MKVGYREWLQKGKYVEELRLVLEKLITKMKILDLVPKTPTKPSSSSSSASVLKKNFLHSQIPSSLWN